VPVTDFEDWALALQHTLGGVDSLPANQQAKVMAVTDVQLERADDLLAALLLQDARTAANHPQRVAAR
jgi:hypothetical protein